MWVFKLLTMNVIPAVIFGRNERHGWGLTNNICSQRDLYLERTSPEHPGHFLYEGEWEPARELVETTFEVPAERMSTATAPRGAAAAGPRARAITAGREHLAYAPHIALLPVALLWLTARALKSKRRNRSVAGRCSRKMPFVSSAAALAMRSLSAG